MFKIQHKSYSLNKLNTSIKKIAHANFKIDVEAIESDIQKLQKREAKSSEDIKNISNIRKLLAAIKNKACDSGGNIGIKWEIEKDGYILTSKEIELTNIWEYGIEMADYIKANKGRIIRLNYPDLNNAIAIDMTYREYGETLRSMEEKLAGLGIIAIHPIEEITKLFDDNVYEISRVLAIGDSPFYIHDKKECLEYFGRKQFPGKFYYLALEYSIKHAEALIIQDLIPKLNKGKFKYKLCSVSNSGIYFIVEGDELEFCDMVKNNIIVEVFGRNFEISPEIAIF